MESKQSWLEVHSPHGCRQEFPLTQDRISIGREEYPNDLPLGPDPDSFISRHHCYLERRHSGWWLIEIGKNATLIRQNEGLREMQGQTLLSDGSTFCILGIVSESGMRLYWSITLHDLGETRSDPDRSAASISLRYDLAGRTLSRLQGKHEEEISLTTREKNIIGHMIERNRHARGAPVLCTNEELLVAAYGVSFSSIGDHLAQPKDSLRHLIKGLRGKLEINPQDPKFLVGYRGQGYILFHTYPLSR